MIDISILSIKILDFTVVSPRTLMGGIIDFV